MAFIDTIWKGSTRNTDSGSDLDLLLRPIDRVWDTSAELRCCTAIQYADRNAVFRSGRHLSDLVTSGRVENTSPASIDARIVGSLELDRRKPLA